MNNILKENNNKLELIVQDIETILSNKPETCTVNFSAHGGSGLTQPADGKVRTISYTECDGGKITPKIINVNNSGVYTVKNILKDSLVVVDSDFGEERIIGDIILKGYYYYNNSNNQKDYRFRILQVKSDGQVKTYTCYLKGTKILLVNKKTKTIENITYNDELLVWDFDNARYTAAKPLWIKKVQVASEYYDCLFSDGTNLKLVGGRGHAHRIFCVETNRFEYANDCVGKMIMSQNGPVRMESCEIKEEEVEFYNIITDYHMNLYANGILSSTGLSNIYPIEDMKYVIEKRELIPIEAFDNCSEKYYYGLRLGEQKEYTLERLNEKLKEIQSLAIENGK